MHKSYKTSVAVHLIAIFSCYNSLNRTKPLAPRQQTPSLSRTVSNRTYFMNATIDSELLSAPLSTPLSEYATTSKSVTLCVWVSSARVVETIAMSSVVHSELQTSRAPTIHCCIISEPHQAIMRPTKKNMLRNDFRLLRSGSIHADFLVVTNSSSPNSIHSLPEVTSNRNLQHSHRKGR